MVAAVAVMGIGFGTVVIPHGPFALRAAALAAVAAACVFLAGLWAGRWAVRSAAEQKHNKHEGDGGHQQRVIARRRAARIAETLARVRVLDPGTAAAPAHLAAIKTEMIKLAGCGLPDLADFPPAADGGDVTYLLHHDPDGRFGLYLTRAPLRAGTAP